MPSTNPTANDDLARWEDDGGPCLPDTSSIARRILTLGIGSTRALPEPEPLYLDVEEILIS